MNACPVVVWSSVHCEKIGKDKQGFVGRAIDRFGRDTYSLQLLSLSDAEMSF